MAIALVAHTTAFVNIGTATITSPGINTTGANFFLVQGCTSLTPSNISTSLTDSAGNAWHPLADYSQNSAHSAAMMWWCAATNVSSTHTFTWVCGTQGFGGGSLIVSAWSGCEPVAPIDFMVTTAGVNTLSPTIGAAAPAQNNCLIVSALCYTNNNLSTATVAGFTRLDTITNGASTGNAMAYLIEGTASSVNPIWTQTATNNQWAGINLVVLSTQTAGTLVTSTVGVSANGTLATTPGFNSTGGNCIIVQMNNKIGITGTCGDNMGNTYTLAGTSNNSLSVISIFYSANPVVSSTHTVTGTANSGTLAGNPIVGVAVFSNMSVTPFDAFSGTALNNSAITPTNDRSIIVTGVIDISTHTDTVTNSGFLRLWAQGSSTNGISGAMGWKFAATKKATICEWDSLDATRASYISAWIVSSNITTNQTITGQARIGLTSSQTTTGKARLGVNVAQTVLGKARITATTLQTILGKASIKGLSTQTLLGKARLTNTANQTVTGKARIRVTVSQTVTGLSRILLNTTKTLTGQARLLANTNQSITGKAAIQATTSQMLTGLARLSRTVSQTIMGQAKIFRQTNVSPARIFHVMADTRRSTVVAEPREFDALKDERVYKVLE